MPQKPRSDSRRAALREAARREEQRRVRRRLALWIGASAVALAILITAGVLLSRPGVPVAEPTSAVTYGDQARGHAAGTVDYSLIPPVGGDHAEVGQNCGIYLEPVADENAVHSLEHGAIWVTYRPDLPAAQVKVLRDSVRKLPYGLLSPYPGLPAPIVASVWGVQLKVESATDPELAIFLAKYADGTKAPEPKGGCSGGVGTPQR